MTWLATVAPYDTIQSLWGNTIRDRAIFEFATIAERDTNIPSPHEGQCCWVTAEAVLFLRFKSAWNVLSMDWRTWPANLWIGTPTGAGSPVSSSDLMWTNHLGQVTARGNISVALTAVNPGGFVNVRLPLPTLKANDLGDLYAYNQGNGLLYGGRAIWQGNTPPGQGSSSVAVMQSAGNGVAPGAPVPAGAYQLDASFNLLYPGPLTAYAAA